ncbi:MAG: hypothetical protein ACRC7S_09235 [Cetobacterium sp.]
MFLKMVDEVSGIKKVVKLDSFEEISVSNLNFENQESFDYSLQALNVETLFQGLKTSDNDFKKFKQVRIVYTNVAVDCKLRFIYVPLSTKVFLLDNSGNNIDKF